MMWNGPRLPLRVIRPLREPPAIGPRYVPSKQWPWPLGASNSVMAASRRSAGTLAKVSAPGWAADGGCLMPPYFVQ